MQLNWDTTHYTYNPSHADHPYITQSPHGRLMKRNSFLDDLAHNDTVRLLHITTALDSILAQGSLYPSGGCLVGSLYCAFVHQDKHGLRAHNLGSYIYTHEVVESLQSKNMSGKTMSPLLIEVTVPPEIKRQTQGVDYLSMGTVHLAAFHQLIEQLPVPVYTHIQHHATENICRNQSFWDLCSDIANKGVAVSPEDFFAELLPAIHRTPILGYIYFEALTEYIMLHSNDVHTIHRAERGEINCWTYKLFVYKAQPTLLNRFNLGVFSPSLDTIQRVTQDMQQDGLLNVDVQHLIPSVQWRISDLVVTHLLGKRYTTNLLSHDFQTLAQQVPSLVGHCIDRLLRKDPEYAAFAHTFDTYKATAIWDYWNEQQILFPYNAIMPKGEVGLNPAAHLTHRIYTAQSYMEGNDLYLEKEKELPLQIVPDFLHAKYAFMGLTARTHRS